MIAYKFLARGGRALFSDRHWDVPAGSAPGSWIEAAPGPLDACRNGVHACAPLDLPYWISEELWQVELDGEQITGPQSLIARRGRLVRRVEAWNPISAEQFARGCLERAKAFVADLPARHGKHASAEILDQGAQYLATASSTRDSGRYAVTAYAAAMAFTLLAESAAEAFRAERIHQGQTLALALAL